MNPATRSRSAAVPALIGGLAVWGFAANLLATPMNTQAVEVQKRYERPILSTFHAGFSVGMLAGGLLGTAAAAVGLTPGGQVAIASVLLGVLLVWTQRWLPDAERATDADGGRREPKLRDRFTPQLLLLATIAFLSAFTEMAGAQWSGLYTAETLRAGAVAGAATYTCLAVAATIARLFGDRIAARLGRLPFVRMSALLAAVGLSLALAGGRPAVAMAGFALLGLGMACVTPTIIGFAGQQPGLTSGEGVSVVVLGQWPGLLLAAPLVGTLAGLASLRVALLVVVATALAIVPLTLRIRAHEPAGEPAPVR